MKHEIHQTKKRVLFNSILILFIVGFFLLIEGILRLTDYGTSYHLFLEKEFNEKTYLAINPQAGGKYFANLVIPDVSTDMFLKVKPEKTYRVFVLGASTSAGYPWEYNFSFSNILKEHLFYYKPNFSIEMVNLSMPALNSYAVVDIFSQIMEYEPDLVIVYMGHNEFYGSMGAGGGGHSVFLKRTILFFRDFRLYQLLENFWQSVLQKNKTQNSSILMHRLAYEHVVTPDSKIRDAVYRQYQKNLNALCRKATQNDIELLLMRPVSNIVDYPPFKSFSNLQNKPLKSSFKNIESLMNQGNCLEAQSLLEKIVENDPNNAFAHYLLGKCFLEQNNIKDAIYYLIRARDLDGYPFRMTSPLDTLLHETAEKWSVPLFDTEKVLELNAPHLYSQVFCDHLHFSIEGLQRVGEALAEDILRRPVDLVQKMDHFTRLDSLLGELRLDVLRRSWPFTEKFYGIRPQFYPQTAYDRLIMDVWERRLTWEEGHVYAANLLEEEGDIAGAIQEYKALWHLMPYNEAPLVEKARLYIQLQSWEKASEVGQKALSIYFNPRALLYTVQAEAAQAHFGMVLSLIHHYQDKIIHTNPQSQGVLYYFQGWAYANNGEYSQALASLDKALDLLPGYQQALKLKHDIEAVFQ
ncbi:MAG: tetratricopeptide repeat protein [Candidatus Marinimicrobia bacterium]|nr:tetratricopeptide repeat protein [Candidatus Neomarinimicrobiota bacterium]